MSEEPRNVLFLIPTLQGGGAERVIVTLLRHLDRRSFRPALAVVDGRAAVYQQDLPEDVEFIDLRTARVRNALPRIARLIWERRPDIVFSTLAHLNLALATMRPLLPKRTRFVARETSILTEVNRTRSHPQLWSSAYRRFYPRLDAVVCISAYMRDDLMKNFGLPAGIGRVIYNPVDIDRVRRLASEPVETGYASRQAREGDGSVHLVAAGRLLKEKGFDILLEALALCRNPSLKLTILGQGPQRQELERMVSSLKIEKQVTFAGFQRNPYPFFAQADMFVLSSRYEGFCNVVVEAMACGTPVISTPAVGGVPEILKGISGCLLAEDVTAIALARAIQSRRAWARLPEAVVQSYAVEKITSEYSRTLLDVLDGVASQRRAAG